MCFPLETLRHQRFNLSQHFCFGAQLSLELEYPILYPILYRSQCWDVFSSHTLQRKYSVELNWIDFSAVSKRKQDVRQKLESNQKWMSVRYPFDSIRKIRRRKNSFKRTAKNKLNKPFWLSFATFFTYFFLHFTTSELAHHRKALFIKNASKILWIWEFGIWWCWAISGNSIFSCVN